jgi:uncharacterized protein (UPF0147 family)
MSSRRKDLLDELCNEQSMPQNYRKERKEKKKKTKKPKTKNQKP